MAIRQRSPHCRRIFSLPESIPEGPNLRRWRASASFGFGFGFGFVTPVGSLARYGHRELDRGWFGGSSRVLRRPESAGAHRFGHGAIVPGRAGVSHRRESRSASSLMERLLDHPRTRFDVHMNGGAARDPRGVAAGRDDPLSILTFGGCAWIAGVGREAARAPPCTAAHAARRSAGSGAPDERCSRA